MTQPQREALLDLLILAIFVDSRLSVAEDAALEAAFRTIGWEGAQPRDVFICRSLSRARRVRDAAPSTALYISSRTAAFEDEDSQTVVLHLLEQVFEADGLAESEAEFLVQVKEGFR